MEHHQDSSRSRVRRKPERARYDRHTVHEILDAALVCHVGIVRDGVPMVLPMTYGRDGDTLLIHGSTGSGIARDVKHGHPMCVTVTLVDALVFARAARNHSMNYRSVLAFGTGTILDGRDDKMRALEIILEHSAPGRWTATRSPSEAELRETTVVSMPIDEASAKIRTGPPLDVEADADTAAWAGIVPVHTRLGDPEPAHFSPADATIVGLHRVL